MFTHLTHILLNHIWCVVVLLVLISGSPVMLESAEKFFLSTYAGPPLSNQQQTGICDLIAKTAFQRLNIDVEIIRLPAERSIANANLGFVDGEFVRISGLGKIYPNLLEVPEKIITYEFVAFSRHHLVKQVDWNKLKPYHVAIVRGWKILEKKLGTIKGLKKVKNQDLLFTLLAKNRTDFVIYARREGTWVLNRLDLQDVIVWEPPLATKEMYLYLNKKNKALIPQLVAVLRRMKQDGSFKRILKTASGS